MVSLHDGMTLFHGSYAPIGGIDLEKCATGKDFGRGFYLTSDKEQARSFIRTSLAKAKRIGIVAPDHQHGYVSAFRFTAPEPPLRSFEFPTANSQWLRFVALNRRKNLADKLSITLDSALLNADVIIGKIANDATNPIITAYLNGIYGAPQSTEAANMAIGLLLPERLKDQYCFLTERAIECLQLEGVSHFEF